VQEAAVPVDDRDRTGVNALDSAAARDFGERYVGGGGAGVRHGGDRGQTRIIAYWACRGFRAPEPRSGGDEMEGVNRAPV
jgi:hypothetical protein